MEPTPHYKKGDKIGGRYLVHEALMGGMGECKAWSVKNFRVGESSQHRALQKLRLWNGSKLTNLF